MQVRKIKLIASSIKNGRIYFPNEDVSFFPADALSDRKEDGHKGKPVVFTAGGILHEGSIRHSSGIRLSPERSFGGFLKAVNAHPGDSLHVERTSDREYAIQHVRSAE